MRDTLPSTLPQEPDTETNGDAGEAAPSGFRAWLFQVVPALAALRSYGVASFRADLFAGLTVAAVAVPQAMAYAMVAGLEPQYGLYTAIVMTAVGAVFDSSRQLINGPTNAIAIALLSAIAAIPDHDKPAAAVLLALLVGLIQMGVTLLRLGDLTRYISHSVIVGFTAGAGLLLILDQLKNLLGVAVLADVHDHFLKRVWLTLTAIGSANPWAVSLGLGSIGAVLLLRWVKARWRLSLLPEFLLVVIGAAFLVWYLDLDNPAQRRVEVVGHIPRQLPSFQVPEVRWSQVRDLANSALAIAVLGLLEAVAMAKAIAAQTGQKLDINQQCLSEGLANLSGSFFQCFPGSGSLTRSAINQQAGAVTQWSGVISAGAVAAIVLLFAPLAASIPKAALAGLLMLSAWRMVDRKQLVYHCKATRFDALIVLATAFAAVAISIEFCILIGVFLSFLLFVRRAARLHMVELVLTPERIIRERLPTDPRCSRYRMFSMEGEMFFGAAPDLEKHLEHIEKWCRDGIRIVVLRLKRIRNPDAVCIHLLDGFLQRMAARQLPLLLCGVRKDLARILHKTGIDQRLGIHQIFYEEAGIHSSTLRAVQHAYELLGSDLCALCPRRAEAKEILYYMI